MPRNRQKKFKYYFNNCLPKCLEDKIDPELIRKRLYYVYSNNKTLDSVFGNSSIRLIEPIGKEIELSRKIRIFFDFIDLFLEIPIRREESYKDKSVPYFPYTYSGMIMMINRFKKIFEDDEKMLGDLLIKCYSKPQYKLLIKEITKKSNRPELVGDYDETFSSFTDFKLSFKDYLCELFNIDPDKFLKILKK